eukprot:1158595-Pelagomonas_calceolata.AAC.6
MVSTMLLTCYDHGQSCALKGAGLSASYKAQGKTSWWWISSVPAAPGRAQWSLRSMCSVRVQCQGAMSGRNVRVQCLGATSGCNVRGRGQLQGATSGHNIQVQCQGAMFEGAGKERKGQGKDYITGPAYEGSLAEAKGAYNQGRKAGQDSKANSPGYQAVSLPCMPVIM